MPIYEYDCPKCGTFEQLQAISDKALDRCPKCRRKVRKLMSHSSFRLKGGGWYADGYQHRPNDSKKSAGPDGSTGSTSGSVSKGASGPAPASSTGGEAVSAKATPAESSAKS